MVSTGGGNQSSNQFIDPRQLGFLTDIWGKSQNLVGQDPLSTLPAQVAGAVSQQYSPQIANALSDYGRATQGINTVYGGNIAGASPAQQTLAGLFGSDYRDDPGQMTSLAQMFANTQGTPGYGLAQGSAQSTQGTPGWNMLLNAGATGGGDIRDERNFRDLNSLGRFNIGHSVPFSSLYRTGNTNVVRGPALDALRSLEDGEQNPYLDRMVNAAGQSVRRNLSRNILPALQSRGNAANPYGGGGSRQGIAEGIALSDANQQISELASNLYGGAYDSDQARRLAAAQGELNAQEVQQQRRTGAASQGLSAFGQDLGRRSGIYSDLLSNLQGQFGRDLQGQLTAGQSLLGGSQTDLARQLQAGQTLLGADQSDLARQLQAAGQFSGFQDADQARAMQAANSYQQNQLGFGQAVNQNLSQYLTSLASGANNLIQLGTGPYQQAWNQLLNYASIIGQPHNVGTSVGSSSNFGFL